ncbi:MAG: cupin domain-containing protein [Candidatus Asgardarchaeia archaeon]
MYVGHISEVPAEEVKLEGTTKTTIQWLITKEKAGAENFAMRRFVIKPGGTIGKHSHDWEHEIYVLDGEGIVGAGDKEVKVTKDIFLYIPPNVPHWYRNEGASDFVFLCIIPYKEEK